MSVPSGASTGKNEALELRDDDEARYEGKGVLRAVGNVNNEIAPAIVGLDAYDQEAVDRLLIGLGRYVGTSRTSAPTPSWGVSVALAQAAAASRQVPLYRSLAQDGRFTLPVPMFQCPERRAARRRLDRLPGVHGRAGRIRHFPRVGPSRGGGLSCATSTAARPWIRNDGRRRGGPRSQRRIQSRSGQPRGRGH